MSIAKQVFLHLHPEIEAQVKHFWQVKKAQRDEVYDRVCKELIAQKEKEAAHPFFTKHAKLTRMVNRKALHLFTDRECRTDLNIVNNSNQLLNSTSHALNTSDYQGMFEEMNTPRPETTMNRTNKAKLRMDLLDMPSYSPTDWQPSSMKSPKAINTSKFVSERNTPKANLNVLDWRSTPKHQQRSHFNRTLATVDRSPTSCKSNHERFLEDFSTALVNSSDEHALSPVRNRLAHTPLNFPGPDRENQDKTRYDDIQEGASGLLERSETPVARRALRTQKANTNSSQRTPTNRSKQQNRIRKLANTENSKNRLAMHLRTSQDDQARSAYLEKVKLPEAQDIDDLEQFRFKFGDEDPNLAKRHLVFKNRSVLDKTLPELKTRHTLTLSKESPHNELGLSYSRVRSPVSQEHDSSRSQSPATVNEFFSFRVAKLVPNVSNKLKLDYLETKNEAMMAREDYYPSSLSQINSTQPVKRAELVKRAEENEKAIFKRKMREIICKESKSIPKSRSKEPHKPFGNRSFNNSGRQSPISPKIHASFLIKGTKSNSSFRMADV